MGYEHGQKRKWKGDGSKTVPISPLKPEAKRSGVQLHEADTSESQGGKLLHQKADKEHTSGRSTGHATSEKSRTPRKAGQVTVPHSRLSFGEELEEESAEPCDDFSIGQSTKSRFQEESKRRVPLETLGTFNTNGTDSVLLPRAIRPHLGQIICGAAQARGPRPYMEDRYTFISSFVPLSFDKQPVPDDVMRSFAAVYDGHNGAQAADYAKERLHAVLAQEPAVRDCRGELGDSIFPWVKQEASHRESKEAQAMTHAVKHAFRQVDEEILDRCRHENGRDGSCALVVLRIGELIFAAHAGDSRAVLCRGGDTVRLTEDHKPELMAEKQRVEANGGRVEMQRCWRVICPASNGRPASGLAVSRSLGDLDFKEPARYIECEPDVSKLRASPEDRFIVMASDGLWDVMEDRESVAIVQDHLGNIDCKNSSKATLDAAAKEAASLLLLKAAEKKSMDNITALVLLLQWH